MKKISAPNALVVPFCYPDYPTEVIKKQIRDSELALKNTGLDVHMAPSVLSLDDVSPAAEFIKSTKYDVIIALVVSWVEAPWVMAVLRPYLKQPILLWSQTYYTENNVGISLGALPASGVLRETLEEVNANFAFMYGMPDDSQLMQDIYVYAHSAAVFQALAGARVGLIGYVSMGMYTGTIDHTQLRYQIGPEIDQIDQYEVVNRFDKVSEKEIEKLLPLADGWKLNQRINTEDLSRVFRMYAAIKSLAEEHRWDALTVKCQYELSRTFGLAPCLPLSIIGDEIVASCEGDVPLIISQLILYYLTGDPISYGDLHNVTEDHTLWGACGYAPLSFAYDKPVIDKHTALYAGLLNSSPYKTGNLTLARLSAYKGGFKMHVTTGEAQLPPPFHEIGCPVYPFVNIKMDGNVKDFMQNLGSQHYGIAYGKVSKELEFLCKMLGMKYILS